MTHAKNSAHQKIVMKKEFSPNFTAEEINVEFLVIHYSACDLAETLRIFHDKARGVCTHFIVDTNGDLYDLGGDQPFLTSPILRAAHAGTSHFTLGETRYESLNKLSIGVELVNLNGNLIEFPEPQIQSLYQLTLALKNRFSILQDPNRVVGHEHIAGFRGKVDPGRLFNWKTFFQNTYPGLEAPLRKAVLNDELWSEFLTTVTDLGPIDGEFTQWSKLSARLESFVGKQFQAK